MVPYTIVYVFDVRALIAITINPTLVIIIL